MDEVCHAPLDFLVLTRKASLRNSCSTWTNLQEGKYIQPSGLDCANCAASCKSGQGMARSRKSLFSYNSVNRLIVWQSLKEI